MAPTLALLLLCQLTLYTTVTTLKGCSAPLLRDGMDLEGVQIFYSPGDTVLLSCKKGYAPSSNSRNIICMASGEWSNSKVKCLSTSCSYPEALNHGDMDLLDIQYQSTINYTCHEGYTLQGASTIECLANGEWSEPPPKCLPVTCGLPPIPKNGKVVYDMTFTGNTTTFGFGVTYECLNPLVLFGNERGMCHSNGKWTEPPACKFVICPRPTGIPNGFMTTDERRAHGYKETIRYGCNVDYVLEGPLEIECLKTGNWSEKPTCRASCSVNIDKGRILYRGNKIWIADFIPNKVSHKELVSFYCMNEENKCGYAVSSQCIDATLMIPDCFKEPTGWTYNFQPKNLPSEIKQC